MNYTKVANKYVIKIERGEMIMVSLGQFCKDEKIKNGLISGVGAVDWTEMAHYSVDTKKYSSFIFEEALEVISLNGNVFLDEKGEDVIIHVHAAMGKSDGQMVGGHLVEARVAAACEIVLENIETEIGKKYDETTGLKLMDL